MQEFGTFMFHTVVHWHKLSEVENECTLHDFIVLAIFAPEIIKFSKHLTKLWKNKFWLFFSETYCSTKPLKLDLLTYLMPWRRRRGRRVLAAQLLYSKFPSVLSLRLSQW